MNASLETAMVDQEAVDRHVPVMTAFVKDPDDAHVAACACELLAGDHYGDATTIRLTAGTRLRKRPAAASPGASASTAVGLTACRAR